MRSNPIRLPEHSVLVGTKAFDAMFYNQCEFIPMVNEPVEASFAKKLASDKKFMSIASLMA